MTTATYKNPLLLTRKPISFVHEPNGPAAGKAEKLTNSYRIIVYDQRAKDLYQKSPYYGLIPYAVFELAVVTHEVFHILGETLDFDAPFGGFVIEYIMNVLDDSHDEYHGMWQFPDYGRYVQLLLSCLKWVMPPHLQQTSIFRDLDTLYLLARFGVVRNKGADADFVSFILPLVLSAIRGSRANVITSGVAIYEYLRKKSRQSNQQQREFAEMNLSTMGQGILDMSAMQDIAASPQVANSAHFDIVRDILAMLQGQKDTQQFASGHLAGLDGPPPDDGELTDEFYRQTVAMYQDVIIRLRNLFLQTRHKVKRVRRYEGEINPRYEERIYEASLDDEEFRGYIGLKRLRPRTKSLLFRDVSGSIDAFKVEYARAIVVFLAALDGLEGVDQGLIDFNSYFNTVMQFGDKVSTTRVYPIAEGGTVLHPALLEADTWNWAANGKYAVLVTDGGIAYWNDICLPILEGWNNNGVRVILVEIVNDPKRTDLSSASYNAIPPWMFGVASTIDLLPERLMYAIVQ